MTKLGFFSGWMDGWLGDQIVSSSGTLPDSGLEGGNEDNGEL